MMRTIPLLQEIASILLILNEQLKTSQDQSVISNRKALSNQKPEMVPRWRPEAYLSGQ